MLKNVFALFLITNFVNASQEIEMQLLNVQVDNNSKVYKNTQLILMDLYKYSINEWKNIYKGYQFEIDNISYRKKYYMCGNVSLQDFK